MTNEFALWLSIGAGAIAILYGVLSTQWILKQPAGSERMQEISAAIQEGARRLHEPPVHDDRRSSVSYLFIAFSDSGPRLGNRRWFRDRRYFLCPRRLHRHVCVRSRQCAHGSGRDQGRQSGAERRVPRRRYHRHARRRPRSPRRRRLLLIPADPQRHARRYELTRFTRLLVWHSAVR